MSILSDIENNFSEITVNDLVRLGFKFRTAVVVYWDSSEYSKSLTVDNLNEEDARNKILEGLHYWKKTVFKDNTTFNVRYYPETNVTHACYNDEVVSIAGCVIAFQHSLLHGLCVCRKVNDIMDVEAALAEIKIYKDKLMRGEI